VKFNTAIYSAEGILHYVHMNIWGPIKMVSLESMHYFMSFIDDLSRHCWVYTMRYKGKVLDLFVEWKKHMETLTGRKIKILHLNNGCKYTNDPFLWLCHDEDIERCFIVKETPQQNGVAERMNQTLLQKIRYISSKNTFGLRR